MFLVMLAAFKATDFPLNLLQDFKVVTSSHSSREFNSFNTPDRETECNKWVSRPVNSTLSGRQHTAPTEPQQERPKLVPQPGGNVQSRKHAAGPLIKHSIRQKKIWPLIPVISPLMISILNPTLSLSTTVFQHMDVWKSKGFNSEAMERVLCLHCREEANKVSCRRLEWFPFIVCTFALVWPLHHICTRMCVAGPDGATIFRSVNAPRRL